MIAAAFSKLKRFSQQEKMYRGPSRGSYEDTHRHPEERKPNFKYLDLSMMNGRNQLDIGRVKGHLRDCYSYNHVAVLG